MTDNKFEAARGIWLVETTADRRKEAERIYRNYALAMQYRKENRDNFKDKAPINRDSADWCLIESTIEPTQANIALWQAGYDDYEGERL